MRRSAKSRHILFFGFADGKQAADAAVLCASSGKICDLHEERLKEGKSGIDVVCILWGIVSELFQNDDGAAEMQAAVKRAADLGVWVNSGHLDFAGNKLWRESRVCCKADGDLDNPDDYTVMPNQLDMAKFPELVRNTLCFPGGGRTVAGSVRLDAYRFSAPGFRLSLMNAGCLCWRGASSRI